MVAFGLAATTAAFANLATDNIPGPVTCAIKGYEKILTLVLASDRHSFSVSWNDGGKPYSYRITDRDREERALAYTGEIELKVGTATVPHRATVRLADKGDTIRFDDGQVFGVLCPDGPKKK
jgi:hypothetical protein